MQKTNQTIVIIGDSIDACLIRFPCVLKKYFTKSVNLGVGGDQIEHVLCPDGNIDMVMVITCSANNIGLKTALDIATGIMKIASTLLEKDQKMKSVTKVSYHEVNTGGFVEGKHQKRKHLYKKNVSVPIVFCFI